MALSRNKKEALVEDYSGSFAEAPHAFLMDFKGVSVPQMTDLRAKIRETGGSYVVVKNTLARRVAAGQPLDALKEYFEGPTAIAYHAEDPVGLAKVLSDFAKDVPELEFKAGLVEGSAVQAEQIREIATLPSRDELVAKLLYLMQSPVTRFVRGLGSITQQFVGVLDQVRAQKEGQG